jgi:hypothetical protein
MIWNFGIKDSNDFDFDFASRMNITNATDEISFTGFCESKKRINYQRIN